MIKRLSLTITLFALLFLTPCFGQGGGCDKILAQPLFSDALKAKGIHFLMSRVTVDHFSRLLQSGGVRGKLPATHRGIGVQTSEGFALNEVRYNMSLVPLAPWHTSHWAHYLIANGDLICAGIRYVGPLDFKAGFVFPVEILDKIPFYFTSSATVEDRKMAMVGLSRDIARFDSSEGNPTDFAKIIEPHLKEDKQKNRLGFDASPSLHFHFPEGLPFDSIAILWLPRPLHQWILLHPREFSNLAYAKSSLDVLALQRDLKSTEIRIYSSKGIPTVPPPALPHEIYDPKTGMGTWYTVVPNFEALHSFFENNPDKLRQAASSARALIDRGK